MQPPPQASGTAASTRLLAEIRELGYRGSANLLVRYLNQGRAQAERAAPAPRRQVSWTTTRPADLPDHDRGHLQELLACCPHQAILAEHVRAFAELLTRRRGTDLEGWMSAVEASDLPRLHGFVRGLPKDLPAVLAGLSLPYSNGPIEGANTKVKLLKRQMYGRAPSRYSASGSCSAEVAPPLLRQSRCSYSPARSGLSSARAG